MKRWPQEIHDAKAQAKAEGRATFEATPCRKCGSTIRAVANNACVKCRKISEQARHNRNPLKRALNGAKWRAKIAGLDFDIVEADLTIPEVCPVLGTPMVCPSLDRWNNSRGYVRGNVRVISMEANRLKNNLTLDQAKRLVIYMEGCM